MYEGHRSLLNETPMSVSYEIREMFEFIDQQYDMFCLVYVNTSLSMYAT